MTLCIWQLDQIGPKGRSQKITDTVVELKRCNPHFQCIRIAQQIDLAFGINIDQNIGRHVSAARFLLDSGASGQ